MPGSWEWKGRQTSGSQGDKHLVRQRMGARCVTEVCSRAMGSLRRAVRYRDSWRGGLIQKASRRGDA